MIRQAAVATLAAVALLVGIQRPLRAHRAAQVTLEVLSGDPSRQVTFGLRAFGASMTPVAGDSLLHTPYRLTVTDEEFYALVRKEGDGDIRVSVRGPNDALGSSALGITMIVASRDRITVTGFAR